MTLTEMMEKYAQLRQEADVLEKAIRAEVQKLKTTIVHQNVRASYSCGRGSYDYEAIAREAQVPEALIAVHTRLITDWRAACMAIVLPGEVYRKHYTPGTPTVTIKLEED
jgi:hypothetical protein